MKILLRAVAGFFGIIAAVLVYAVIAAIGSDGGAKPGVAVAYIVGAIVLAVAAGGPGGPRAGGSGPVWRRPVGASRQPAWAPCRAPRRAGQRIGTTRALCPA